MSYGDDIAAVRARRLERLRAPHGWLSLVARHVLEEGDNRLPVGVVTRRGSELWLDGRRLGDGEQLERGSERWEVVVRGQHMWLRVRDPEAPARAAFAGLDYYPLRPEWRIEGRFEPYPPGRRLEVSSSADFVMAMTCPGAVVLPLPGGAGEARLDAAREDGERPKLHLVFADPTNRDETYGGGRFVYADWPEADNRVVVDFNLAMNPPCAFNEHTVCPLPPPQNSLAVRVEAGEKRPH